MSQVYITLSKEMLQALLANLIDLKFPASDFLVENEVDGINEITRIINLVSGDVFEQAVQKQDIEQVKGECKIYEFPPKPAEDFPLDEGTDDPDCLGGLDDNEKRDTRIAKKIANKNEKDGDNNKEKEER